MRYANAYATGLDDQQAAWAIKKYKGHRTLPPDLLRDMAAENMGRNYSQRLL
jgi:hypothetical protein